MSAWTRIAHTEVGTAVSNIDFTSIPNTYDDLLIVYSLRSSGTSNSRHVALTFNNNASGYSYRRLLGDGSGASSGTEGPTSTLNLYHTTTAASDTASTFGNGLIYIPNYKGSTQKSVSVDAVTENNATLAYQLLYAGIWTGTDAITSVKLTEAFGSNWVQYSSATLYGITKGSSGGVSVS